MQPEYVMPGKETDVARTPGRVACDGMVETLQRGPVSDPSAKRWMPRLDIERDREGLCIIPSWVGRPRLSNDNCNQKRN